MSAAINNGSASPTEALDPYRSANKNTDTIDIPLNPAFESPMQKAASKAMR